MVGEQLVPEVEAAVAVQSELLVGNPIHWTNFAGFFLVGKLIHWTNSACSLVIQLTSARIRST